MPPPDVRDEWEARGPRYRETISSGSSSSAWLRDALLKPEIVRLLGDRRNDRVLDAGTGGGWLFDALEIGERHACDIAPPEVIRADVAFAAADIGKLPYSNGFFDAIVANIVLCYCEDLDQAAAELQRVTAVGGALVVALVHPHFYRTGKALEDDSFQVEADLARGDRFDIMIGETAGPFTYYRYSIPDYVNALVGAGWTLREMSELFIPRDQYEVRYRATDLVRRSTRVPLFVTMELVKG
jgi:SAM-dependent methyltransferase